MKEEGGGISEKRRLYDPSTTAEWASLQPDLVQLIADCVLSTSGVDEYMAMRAVCPSWRSAVAKPSPHAAVADPRFRPGQWVVLHGADDDQSRPLFLNISTGRFRRLRRPVLRDYIFVGASDGLLVLGDRERPHAARLLNPLTGDVLPFAAPIPGENRVATATTGSEPSIIFSFYIWNDDGYRYIPAYYSLQQDGHQVYSADPTGQLRPVKFDSAAFNENGLFDFQFQHMVTCAGNVYVLSREGALCKIIWTSGHWYAESIMEIDMHHHGGSGGPGGLVESAGKLLLVKEKLETIEVCTIDVKRKVLEPIESIGSSALFLSYGKCLLVDADKLPSINCNCIYSTSFAGMLVDSICVSYDLSDGKKRCFSVLLVPRDGSGAESDFIHEGPLSLAQVLLTPYPRVKAQLDRIQQI